MKIEIQRILNMNFFKIVQTTKHSIHYIYEKPCRMLMQNIGVNWLQFINTKTQKHMPVFINKNLALRSKEQLPFGFISSDNIEYDEKTIIEQRLNEFTPRKQSKFNFNIVVPQEDVMQYFIQWQRYRKFWWSSVTTTPSLFSVNDIKYGENTADVDVVAQFPWGEHAVETVRIYPNTNIPNSSCLSCTMSLENALFVLFLDGLSGQNKNNYLRLHKKMTPYKISFALKYKEAKEEQTLRELSKLLYLRLKMKKVSAWLPNFELPHESQIQDNLQLGVTYTAVLSDDTLRNGIFHLLNSSTMLKEQVHVADFDSYASLLFEK
ncbi:LOW QUALITY PROTEIN: DNA polymerase subunit gamma-2, mitochondrial [Aphomia sociella]